MAAGTRKTKVRKGRLLEGILAALVIISLLNLFVIYTMLSSISPGEPAVEKPPELKLTKISSSCRDCFDAGSVVSRLKQAVSIQSERSVDSSSSEARQLVSRYNISRLPAIIITGDIDKAPSLSQFGERVGDAYVFREAAPPFVDASTGMVVGKVSITIIGDPKCNECFDISTLPAQLQQAGARVSENKTVSYGTSEAQALVSKYNITKIPAAVLSKDLSAYPEISEGWSRLGTQAPDGSYVLREIVPPYVSLDTGEVKGRVEFILLNDSSCSSCYDVTVQPQILRRFGLYFSGNSTVDVNSTEGRQLVANYGITSVPTVLLSPDASVYPLLGQVWPQVGTVEPDGWFVFRNLAAIRGAAYRNLTTGNITAPALPASQQ